jgi:hypothetical protein
MTARLFLFVESVMIRLAFLSCVAVLALCVVASDGIERLSHDLETTEVELETCKVKLDAQEKLAGYAKADRDLALHRAAVAQRLMRAATSAEVTSAYELLRANDEIRALKAESDRKTATAEPSPVQTSEVVRPEKPKSRASSRKKTKRSIVQPAAYEREWWLWLEQPRSTPWP